VLSDDLLLQAHLVATAVLAGMVWVVQLVVYPAFRTVGPTAAWDDHHRRHSTAMATVIALVTVTVSVPLHTRLGDGYDDGLARRLISTNWWRTAAWTAGTCCAAVLAA